MISSNQPSSLDRLPWKYAFRPLFIGFFLYVAITLYNDGLWLVTLNLNAAESFLSRLSLVIQRLLWDRSLTFTFSSLAFAYTAYKNATKDNPLPDKDGFTADQRFFLAFAGVWANNITDQEILRRTKTDSHSLGRWRVNGALPQIDAWYEAFNITEADPMFIPKEKRADVW